MIEEAKIQKIGALLSNSTSPMKARYRALFTLKSIGGHSAIDLISSNFSDGSSLLKHELAYCLGQMQDDYALDVLRKVVEDKDQDPIVRHEAAEALGAIGNAQDLDLLDKYSKQGPVELMETCQIAADRIRWLQKDPSKKVIEPNPFNTVDPAPATGSELSVPELKQRLLDEDLSLFTRYQAMFALRNKQTEDGVLAIASGFQAKSALFRHEVAYVLGQLAHPASEPALTSVLIDRAEHSMVRHECAEALGAVATPSGMETLQQFLGDEERIVRESCEVALDMSEYNLSDDFQYANSLVTAS